jgi:aminopeptidase YwaD
MAKGWLGIFLITAQFSLGQFDEKEFVKTLCSPAFHGRGYVKSGDSIAAEFIASTFKKSGLKPYGKSYFQSFHHDVNTFPGPCLLLRNDTALLPGIHFLVAPSSRGGDMVLYPKRMDPREFLNAKNPFQVIKEVQSGKTFNSLAIDMTRIPKDSLKYYTYLTEELSYYFPVLEITNSKFTWSVAHEQTQYPYILVQDSIFTDSSTYRLQLENRFISSYTSRNVMGYLPAKRKTKKTVFITAHYDHLGRMGLETYFPGANDNASGTSMLLALANHFKEQRTKYNLVFIAFAGEEAGLIGSRHYVDNPVKPLKNIHFLLNLDIMGSGEEGITVVNATLHDSLFNRLTRINSERSYLSQVKSRGPAANSDHYWFTQQGVPAFFIYTMGPNKNYHDVFDLYENLSFSAYQNIRDLLIQFIEEL